MNLKLGTKKGFTLVEIMVVVAIIGLLAAVALPSFLKTRTTVNKNACINNLMQIDSATQQWALENKKNPNDLVLFSDISAYLKNGTFCPAGGRSFADSYLITTVGAEPACQKSPGTHLFPGPSLDVITTTTPTTPTGPSQPPKTNPGKGNGAGNGNGNGNGNAGGNGADNGNGGGNGNGKKAG